MPPVAAVRFPYTTVTVSGASGDCVLSGVTYHSARVVKELLLTAKRVAEVEKKGRQSRPSASTGR